ncbi:hypothetical protein NQ314_007803 [Rhamnusium bicolor]|uniref:Acyltransferase 3 domain-containing protein n=1 Tax=Rhamnusium bicolor TaxID=1586634 RepID=A0AAV8YHI8_9CUCU|nr:hypothetical protein NQ314_007803 [Rhamnusium bicolor]
MLPALVKYILNIQVRLREVSKRIINAQPRGANTDVLSIGPKWAICLPSNCTDEDVGEILLNLIGSNGAVCQTKYDLNPPLTNGAIATIAALSYFALLLVTSTIYDLYLVHKNKEPPFAIFVAFSVHRNGRKLFKIRKNSDELSCLNGIKLLSMFWVIIGHIFTIYPSVMPLTNYKAVLDWMESLSSMIIVSGTLSVDSFFLIGGALVVYGFIKAKNNGVKFNIFYFYLHRYLRLTPALAAAVLVSANLLVYMGSGPLWNKEVTNNQQDCQKYWWTTLLYIQNYVNDDGIFCLAQTWYLTVDMQLYILSPLILLPLWRYTKIGVTLVISCIIAFIIVPFYVAYDNELTGILTNLYPRMPAVLKCRGEKLEALSKERRIRWVRSLKRGELSETFLKNARNCSNHFVTGE